MGCEETVARCGVYWCLVSEVQEHCPGQGILPGGASRRPFRLCPGYGQVSQKPRRRRVALQSKTDGMLSRRAVSDWRRAP